MKVPAAATALHKCGQTQTFCLTHPTSQVRDDRTDRTGRDARACGNTMQGTPMRVMLKRCALWAQPHCTRGHTSAPAQSAAAGSSCTSVQLHQTHQCTFMCARVHAALALGADNAAARLMLVLYAPFGLMLAVLRAALWIGGAG